MEKMNVARDPEEYLRQLRGWRSDCVDHLRSTVLESAELEETIKWGHLVYLSNGPVLLIRAEQERVLFGFWRGKRLLDIEPALKPSGKYEMASIELRGKPYPARAVINKLVRRAVACNLEWGNPQDAAKKNRPPEK